MPTIDDGGPAFPTRSEGQIGPSSFNFEGMSKRDLFAAFALVALPNIGCGADLEQDEYAIAAFQIADAMLAASKRR